jgi:hypothetical protein
VVFRLHGAVWRLHRAVARGVTYRMGPGGSQGGAATGMRAVGGGMQSQMHPRLHSTGPSNLGVGVGGRCAWPRRPHPGSGPIRRTQTSNSKPRCGRHMATESFCQLAVVKTFFRTKLFLKWAGRLPHANASQTRSWRLELDAHLQGPSLTSRCLSNYARVA